RPARASSRMLPAFWARTSPVWRRRWRPSGRSAPSSGCATTSVSRAGCAIWVCRKHSLGRSRNGPTASVASCASILGRRQWRTWKESSVLPTKNPGRLRFQQLLEPGQALRPVHLDALNGFGVGQLVVLDRDLGLVLALRVEVDFHRGFLIHPEDAQILIQRRL